jgi:four helix bundle protein
MNAEELLKRCQAFAISIVRFCRRLPADWVDRTLGGQLLRAGTAVSANYRAACRARSPKEFCAKIGVVAEEADESFGWLELLAVDAPNMSESSDYKRLFKEADELAAIFTSSHTTAKANLQKQKEKKKQDKKNNRR